MDIDTDLSVLNKAIGCHRERQRIGGPYVPSRRRVVQRDTYHEESTNKHNSGLENLHHDCCKNNHFSMLSPALSRFF